MAEATGISWAHHSQNFWMGCDKVDPGCAHCYIDRSLKRLGHEPWGEITRTRTAWNDPDKWNRRAQKAGSVDRVFTCSISDFFHHKADQWRAEAWEIIKRTPHLVWLVLTKRPERIHNHLPADWGEGYPNVWLGVTVAWIGAFSKMDTLRKIPVHPKAVRWISAEPLLEDISAEINLDGFGWVVAGGESGGGEEYLWDRSKDWRSEFNIGGRRTMKLEWAERLRDKTKAAGLPFMFKQVTWPQSGYGVNALGRDWHEYPPPPLPHPWRSQPAIEEKHLFTAEQLVSLDEGGRPTGAAGGLMDQAIIDNQQGIPAEPSQMTNEALAAFVRDSLKKFAKIIPYIQELRGRFAALPRGKADIMGCHTWEQFCVEVLDRTPSGVRKALAAADKDKVPAKPKTLLRAIKTVLPYAGEADDAAIRFSVSENGNVLISAKSSDGEAESELDVKAPIPDPDITATLRSTNSKGEPIELNLGQPIWAPFGFKANPQYIIDFLKEIDGDPTIVLHGRDHVVLFTPSDDGELHFFYEPPRMLITIPKTAPTAVKPSATEPEKPASVPAPKPEPVPVQAVPVQLTEEQRQARAAWQEQRKREQREQQALDEVIGRMPEEVRCAHWGPSKSPGRVRISFDLTIEQLEKIVNALQPLS